MSEARGPPPRVTAPERLTEKHNLSSFENGKHPSLDQWLKERALASEGLSARTYVICATDSPRRVVGFYAVATAMESNGSPCPAPDFDEECLNRSRCCSSHVLPLIECSKDWGSEANCSRMHCGGVFQCPKSQARVVSLLTPSMMMPFVFISGTDSCFRHSALESC